MDDPTDIPEKFEDQVEAGRGNIQYAQIPAWLLFAASSHAVKCYALLKLCTRPGTRNAAPTQEHLARFCGLSRRDKVAPYLDELESAGAIDRKTVRHGMDRRVIYTVHWNPPQGFDGPITKRDWMKREFPRS